MTTRTLRFSKLFVETEYLRETGALLATRRPRTPSEPPIWAAHLSVAESGSVDDVQYETDRGRFLTRNKNARNAAAVSEGWPLSNSAGRGAGSGIQPAPHGADSARADRDDRVLDHGGGLARGNPGPGGSPP